MADTVQTLTLFPEQKVGTSTNKSLRQVMQFTNRSDGTGESSVAKVTLSSLTGPLGIAPTKLTITEIEYDINGMEVLIQFDRTTPINIARIRGTGGGHLYLAQEFGGLTDTGTGGTGNIIFSTNGQAAGASYDILIKFTKKTN